MPESSEERESAFDNTDVCWDWIGMCVDFSTVLVHFTFAT